MPLSDTMDASVRWRGRRVAVLASGDPLCYGVGAMLARRFSLDEMLVLPQPSAFSLAAARLKWPLANCVTLTLHGRPLDRLRVHLAPGVRILALSADGTTPGQVALLLREAGWGPSRLTVLEHMAGPREGRRDGTAESWDDAPAAALNTVAIECWPGPGARPLSCLAGLPDDAYIHDGQLTKRAVRAATLAALAPLPGECLWDVGAGCGSIAVEWLRAGDAMRAVAVERDPARCTLIAQNAVALGVPELRVVQGTAPEALAGLPPPDAVFLGGGASEPLLWEAAWQALRPGGRLVANTVTVEAEGRLLAWHARHGGELTRLAVARAEPVGGYHGWRPLMSVTQLAIAKPQGAA
jgi:precorrin-6Y C5,15-methyltransferase (decarboxylating)